MSDEEKNHGQMTYQLSDHVLDVPSRLVPPLVDSDCHRCSKPAFTGILIFNMNFVPRSVVLILQISRCLYLSTIEQELSL